MKLDIEWLLGFQRAQFDSAGRWRHAVATIQLAIGASALVSVFLDDHRALYVISIATVLLTGALFLSLAKQRGSREAAERARRASVLMGGLGLNLPEELLEELWRDATVSDAAVNALRDRDYYGSRADPGPQRLYEILHQSAFWTTFLQRKSAIVVWSLFSLSLALSGVVVLVASAYVSQEILVAIGRVVLVVAAFVLTQGLFEAALGHQEAATQGDRIMGRLGAAKAKGFPIGELMHLFMDYNSVVERAPLAFPGVYARYRDRLNKQWAVEEYELGESPNPFGLGLEQNVNRLVDHNPGWTRAFEEEAGRIRAALGSKVLAIEHYGSTAVPGLRAKPIIDMLIGVSDIEAASSFKVPMAALGYDYAGSQGIAEHRVFGKDAARTHLAHVVVYQGDVWQRCLAFRDRLRSDSEVRYGYEALKRNLAADPSRTRESYTAGKTQFIADALVDFPADRRAEPNGNEEVELSR